MVGVPFFSSTWRSMPSVRGGWPRPEDSAEPVRRPPSPQATFWSWVAVALLIAALILPFSLAALVDLVRYLAR